MNRLNLAKDFKSVLRDYRLSPEALKLLADLRLVVLCGLSAVGRNTIINKLVDKGGYWFIVSDTTRKPRINNNVQEQNGVTYWFREEADFLTDLKNGQFLEAEIIHSQQVSGVSIRELKRAHDSGKIAISDFDIGGLINIMHLKPDAVGIILLPPSFNEWLRRIRSRGQMPEAEVVNRLKTGERILSKAMQNHSVHLVVNDDLDHSLAVIDALAHGQAPEEVSQSFVAGLLKQTRAYLKQP